MILAIICYSLGVTAGIGVFLLLGVVLELSFWMGLFGKRRRRASN
jgi:hypothetical protein|tara:strand:- start:313 stop:447 length:135 start_codon:yes stop_codon:yes gene_type:complete